MNEMLLSDLPMNTVCNVIGLDCAGIIRRRLLDLGIVNGTKITSLFKSPSGDPVAFDIRGSTIALRKEDSCKIKIKV